MWSTSESLSAEADAALSRFETGHFAGYGEVHTGARLGVSSRVLASWQTNAGGGLYRGQRSSEYLTTGVRLERAGGIGNRLWLSAGIGGADDASSYGTANVTLGSVLQRRDVTAIGAVNLVHARNTYDDVTGQLAWTPRETGLAQRIHAQLSGGARIGNPAGEYDRWAAISATVRLLGTSALVFARGRSPSDPERAIQGVAYTSVGLRLTFGGTAVRVPASVMAHVVGTGRATAVLSELSADGTHTLTIHAPAQAHVDIMADFTGWNAMPMTRTGEDTWITRISVRSGAHRLNIRLDGGAWAPVPGLPVTSDDFGGSASLLVVP
ncbi:MAG: glycogen-binding domain-containing protein [Gemmatimonadaceae bacterium]